MMKEYSFSILEKLGVAEGTIKHLTIFKSAFTILELALQKSGLSDLYSLDLQILQPLQRLTMEEREILDNMDIELYDLETCQNVVQNCFSKEKRKEYAAYFTSTPGLKKIEKTIEWYFLDRDARDVIISDPFMGSGRPLIRAIRTIGSQSIRRVIGVEPFYLSAFVAFTSIVLEMNCDLSKIALYHGDAFEILPPLFSDLPDSECIDLIVTNPPFTRWSNIREKSLLLEFVNIYGYSDFILRKDAGMQVYSLFLCDILLKKSGLLISVLPLSTFYTKGGGSLKSLIKSNYSIHALIKSEAHSSFSDGSNFSEVILVAERGGNNKKTAFIRDEASFLNYFSSSRDQNSMHKEYYLSNLPVYLRRNWNIFFHNAEFLHFMLDFLKKGVQENKLSEWENTIGSDHLVRGFEIYGSDFFFLPNRHWDIEKEENSFILYNHEFNLSLSIDREYITESLTKPRYYYQQIVPQISTYCLTIPPEELSSLPDNLQKYVEWGIRNGTAASAMKVFGRFWYSHIYECLRKKEPISHVFIGDKVDLSFKSRSVFAHYSPVPIAACKSFYVLRNYNENSSKCLAAWLNSSIFIAILILLSRNISKTWTRLLKEDYLYIPVLDVNSLDNDVIDRINLSFDALIEDNQSLPLWQQMKTESRKTLDLEICHALGIENSSHFLKSLYSHLSHCQKKFVNSE